MWDGCEVGITIAAEDHVILDHGWTEMGQGVNTMALQTLCSETGIDPNIIEVRIDTRHEQEAGMTTGSRGTSLVGNATIEAAKGLVEDLEDSLAGRPGGQSSTKAAGASIGRPKPAPEGGQGVYALLLQLRHPTGHFG